MKDDKTREFGALTKVTIWGGGMRRIIEAKFFQIGKLKVQSTMYLDG